MTIRMKAADSFYADDTGQVRGGDEYEVTSEERAKQREAFGDTRVTDKPVSEAPKPVKRGRRTS